MKVVAIMGSPKGKGNGYTVVKEVERYMKSLGEVEFEYIFLKDANLKLCPGCFSCVSRGIDKCPLKGDDLVLLEEKILAADGVILSSPMHQRNVSWLMKNFIDRLAYTHGWPIFFSPESLARPQWYGRTRTEEGIQGNAPGTARCPYHSRAVRCDSFLP